MPGPLLINGTDLSTLGFRLGKATGWLDAPPRQTPSAQRATRAGAYRTGPTSEGTRKLSLDGVVDAASADAARTAIDQIRTAIARTQPSQIVLPDSATRYVMGWWDGHATDPGNGPHMIQRTLRARLDFTLLDPYAYDLAQQTIVLDATIHRAPLGSAPSFPVITISGAATNPIITLKRWDGAILASLGLTLTTIAGDTLVVDMDARTITKNGSSVLSALTSGDFFGMHPSTAQQNYGALAAEQPYVTTSSGAGTTVYRRAWR